MESSHAATGERFQDIIGTISLGSEMKTAMQLDESGDEDDTAAGDSSTTVSSTSSSSTAAAKRTKKLLTPEQERRRAQKAEQEAKLAAEKQKVREERVRMLSDKLRDKLALYAEQAQGEEDKQIADGGEFRSGFSSRSCWGMPWLVPRLLPGCARVTIRLTLSTSQSERCGRSRRRSSRRSRTGLSCCRQLASSTR